MALEQIGLTQVSGPIGDLLDPVGDAITRTKIEGIGMRSEVGAALAASVQAKLTGRLAAWAVTTGSRSRHLVAGFYEAPRDHAPVLKPSGEMPQRLSGIDYWLATPPINI